MHTAQDDLDRQWRLADHVRACQVDGRVVLLDLRRGRYIGLAHTQGQALERAIVGMPAADATCPAFQTVTPSTDIGRLIRPLLAQGLLTSDAGDRTPDVGFDEPARSLDVHQAMATTRAGSRDLCRFLHAAAVAALWLGGRSMHAIANKVAARRGVDDAGQSMSSERLHGAMLTYEKLRPLVFTARDQCLFDSLALINFLAAERLFPRWVIGVQASPFRAHSWVQSGDTVLNDLHENVRRFKPILVV